MFIGVLPARTRRVEREHRLKVLHVYRTYFPDPPGGLQEAVRQIALATGREGVESRIFTLSPRPDPDVIERPEGRVVRCRSWAAPASCDLGGPAAFRRFAELARWADVIHYQFPWPFADLLHLAVRPAAPAVLTYQSDIVRQRWLGRVYTPLMQRTLNAMAAVVATSPAYARTSPVLAALADPKRLRMIPNGIDEASCTAPLAEARDIDVSQRYGLEAGRYFLFVGVFRYYKGLHSLMAAARQAGVTIVLAGEGPERAALESMAAGLPSGRVRFLGQVTEAEKFALIRDCRALVLPSHLRSEAFGMVLVEAAMLGRPMISCEIGTGTSFVNAHDETGLVVPPEAPVELAAAMSCLAADDALVRRYGEAARARYERLFSGAVLGRAYADAYRGVLNA
jgi:rhamnosyl/mannosyltransferase